MNPKFKVGDIVRVRDWEDLKEEIGLDEYGDIASNVCFIKSMFQYCGKEFEIKKVKSVAEDESIPATSFCYHLSIMPDTWGFSWNFDEETLEPVDQRTNLERIRDRLISKNQFSEEKI